MLYRSLLLAAASLLPLQPAWSQEAETVSERRPHAEPTDDFHGAIVVSAPGIAQLDMLAGTSIVQGVELQRNLDGQLGEVLAKLPGVSATSFSPGASRPVLRGFSGERVRVLTDGLGAIDAASISADHAVTIDPLLTERIEVLRGPAVLLYGSQAIGGAVNVVGKRLPPRVPDEPVHIDAIAAFDTAYDRREIGASLDIPLGANVAFHVDGSWQETGDLQVPGYVASPQLRADLLSSAAEEEEEGHLAEAEELREAASIKGVLPNSWTETYSLGSGLSFFSGNSSLGLSFGYYDTAYGIPDLPGIGHVHEHEDEHEQHDHEGPGGEEEEHEHGEANVSIGMQKYRLDLRGVLDLGDGAFDELRTRWGYSDYNHTEFEGEEVGTVFEVSGIEGRVELVQSARGGWTGSIGAQVFHQDFSARGEEAFVPPNSTDQFSLFALQEVALGSAELEFGGRYEHTKIAADTLGLKRDFDALSGAFGLSYRVGENLRVGINGSRAERAPSAQELFANGPHIATQQFEIGDPDLRKERAWGLEAYLRGNAGPALLSLSLYKNWFDGFIYLAGTGEEEDGLAAYRFLQQDAEHFGVEGEISLPLYRSEEFALLADLRGDYVRASLSDGTPVPRIPPLSLLGALEAQMGDFDARVEVQWLREQTRLAPSETRTDGFTQVNLSLAWHPLTGSENFTLLLQADNLFDVEGRRHASFTKDFVPLAGRNIKLSARASF